MFESPVDTIRKSSSTSGKESYPSFIPLAVEHILKLEPVTQRTMSTLLGGGSSSFPFAEKVPNQEHHE